MSKEALIQHLNSHHIESAGWADPSWGRNGNALIEAHSNEHHSGWELLIPHTHEELKPGDTTRSYTSSGA